MTAAIRRTAGASLVAGCAAADRVGAAERTVSKSFYRLFPIGKVEKKVGEVRIRIFDEYVDGLLGLENWSHVHVFYWFDQNDTPERRSVLRVHPRGDKKNPLTGVFACRAPVRPNLIALTLSKIVSVQGNVVTLEDLDAFDGTPVLDLKPFTPVDTPAQDVRVPAWARGEKVQTKQRP